MPSGIVSHRPSAGDLERHGPLPPAQSSAAPSGRDAGTGGGRRASRGRTRGDRRSSARRGRRYPPSPPRSARASATKLGIGQRNGGSRGCPSRRVSFDCPLWRAVLTVASTGCRQRSAIQRSLTLPPLSRSFGICGAFVVECGVCAMAQGEPGGCSARAWRGSRFWAFWRARRCSSCTGSVPRHPLPMMRQRPPPSPEPSSGKSGLPVPRFVSLKAGRVNVRVGPGEDYKVAWVFTRPSLPVEVIAEFDTWRRVARFGRHRRLGLPQPAVEQAHGRGDAVDEGRPASGPRRGGGPIPPLPPISSPACSPRSTIAPAAGAIFRQGLLRLDRAEPAVGRLSGRGGGLGPGFRGAALFC